MISQTQLLLAKYGNPAASKAAEAAFTAKHMVLYNFPDWLQPHWPKYMKQGVKRQWVNEDVVAPLEAVFRELISTGLVKELKEYNGCWNIRKMRGSDQPSSHSWGLAFDFNATANALGRKWTPGQHGMFSKAFVDVWKKHGFMAGADFPQGDAMHYQLALPQPKVAAPARK